MRSPIKNRVISVFMHVTDIQRSSKWYNELFGVAQEQATHDGTIYDVPMDNHHSPFFTLDANVMLTQPDGKHPQLMLETDDIEAAHNFLTANGIELVSGIKDIGSLYFLAFKDPDGNVLLVGQKK